MTARFAAKAAIGIQTSQAEMIIEVRNSLGDSIFDGNLTEFPFSAKSGVAQCYSHSHPYATARVANIVAGRVAVKTGLP
jgi:hypothetical protein